jgi:hypothetical protein
MRSGCRLPLCRCVENYQAEIEVEVEAVDVEVV